MKIGTEPDARYKCDQCGVEIPNDALIATRTFYIEQEWADKNPLPDKNGNPAVFKGETVWVLVNLCEAHAKPVADMIRERMRRRSFGDSVVEGAEAMLDMP